MLKNNFGYVLKHAQKIQEEISKIQSDLEELRITGSSGGGMVEATANGRQQIISIKFDRDALDFNDVEMLEDLTVAAVNQAIQKSQEASNEQMSKVTGGLLKNLPDGIKIPGLT